MEQCTAKICDVKRKTTPKSSVCTSPFLLVTEVIYVTLEKYYSFYSGMSCICCFRSDWVNFMNVKYWSKSWRFPGCNRYIKPNKNQERWKTKGVWSVIYLWPHKLLGIVLFSRFFFFVFFLVFLNSINEASYEDRTKPWNLVVNAATDHFYTAPAFYLLPSNHFILPC